MGPLIMFFFSFLFTNTTRSHKTLVLETRFVELSDVIIESLMEECHRYCINYEDRQVMS